MVFVTLAGWLSVVMLVPVSVLAIYQWALAMASLWPRSAAAAPRSAGMRRNRFVILIPAHNEEAGLSSTLRSVAALEYPADLVRVVVVADRCTDETAAAARRGGVNCFERTGGTPGKGAAIAWAIDRLRRDGAALRRARHRRRRHDRRCTTPRRVRSSARTRPRGTAGLQLPFESVGNPLHAHHRRHQRAAQRSLLRRKGTAWTFVDAERHWHVLQPSRARTPSLDGVFGRRGLGVLRSPAAQRRDDSFQSRCPDVGARVEGVQAGIVAAASLGERSPGGRRRGCRAGWSAKACSAAGWICSTPR